MPEQNDPPNGSTPNTDSTPKMGSDRRTFDVGPGRSSEVSGFHPAAVPQRGHADEHPTGKKLAVLSLTALGIVYGDIGTSPLYALKECFNQKNQYQLAVNAANVYGILSLVMWSLILVVSVKYLVFIMKADNRGQGGIMALLALLLQHGRREGDQRRRALLIVLGLFGAALLYGDGVITPAISVLGAMEGLNVKFDNIPLWIIVASTLVVLIGLFSVQQFGTAKVGGLFGPVMLLWFLAIGALGLAAIVQNPHVLTAADPSYAVRFFVVHKVGGFLTLGAVVLAVTGAEALYADMGHFGKRPIRVAWFVMVLPSLVLNYFGQGALLIRDPGAAANPFYLLAPPALIWPLLILATAAAVIASQALISGAFSLTQQSIQLGYSPRMTIIHTSQHQAGQIYIPEVNKLLAIGCILIVFAFKTSGDLGAAYGIAVTGTMFITSLLYYAVARTRWEWPRWRAASLTVAFLIVDCSFLLANVVKITHGGWVPLAMALGVFILMSTWKTGRLNLNRILQAGSLPLDLFLKDVEKRKPPRVPGTAVFMTSSSDGVPVVLLHHLKHNKMLHEQVILMSVVTHEIPEIPQEERVRVEKLDHGFWRIIASYGFMETPNVPELLDHAKRQGLRAKQMDTTFYLGRERIIIAGKGKAAAGARRAPADADLPNLARWRKKIFIIMSRNARSATEFFGIPPNRVVELGAQVEF